MAASTNTGFVLPAQTSAASLDRSRINRRRRITVEAGRALEVLGHAIEYLTDEFVYQGGSYGASNSQLDAVRLLMALNRQVYFDCAEIPSLGDRWRALVGLRTA